MKKVDIILGCFVLVPILCLIIPVPLVLLDILFTMNIAVSMIVLFSALFAKEPLDMSTFPTLLLLTTLFRLSLNVSSTRNILLNGEAGNVVNTFGNFVGGGNLVVGGVVFIILIIVQLMVINKGSERVSEVTARFTLDAMPGKQMAIDADKLNESPMKKQRNEERKYSQRRLFSVPWMVLPSMLKEMRRQDF